MTPTAEPLVRPQQSNVEIQLDTVSDRRADLDAKQARVATLLQEVGCEGLLLLEPENFSWLTSGASTRGILDSAEHPALYFSPEQRWLLSSNVDTQRLFDEELDGLGFQLKEWPWHWGREQLLNDICSTRKLACDRPFLDCKVVGDRCRQMRLLLSGYEQACVQALGHLLSHALEATCRTMAPKESEREIAAQISHRLLHRGGVPLALGVAADGRSRIYRRFGFTPTPIHHYALLSATARKYGLHATACRAVAFGDVDREFRKEYDAATKISATYQATSWPDARPRDILTAARRIYQVTEYEHEWLQCPQGQVTGRQPVELAITPNTSELFQTNWSVVWQVSVGAAQVTDTLLVTEKGPQTLTPTEVWPQKRIRVQGVDVLRPDILVR